MSDCPNLAKCPFFNDQLANMPTVAGMMKKNFCKQNYGDCARYLVAKALGSPAVPPDLFPAQGERARKILDKASLSTA